MFNTFNKSNLNVYNKQHHYEQVGQLTVLRAKRFPRKRNRWVKLSEIFSKGKKFDDIAGNLIAFTAKIAVREYAEFACVSLKPKSQIAQHYIDKYNMTLTGLTLSIMVPEIIDLINLYDHD